MSRNSSPQSKHDLSLAEVIFYVLMAAGIIMLIVTQG